MSEQIRKLVEHWRPVAVAVAAIGGVAYGVSVLAHEIVTTTRSVPSIRHDLTHLTKQYDEHIVEDKAYKSEMLRRQALILENQIEQTRILRGLAREHN